MGRNKRWTTFMNAQNVSFARKFISNLMDARSRWLYGFLMRWLISIDIFYMDSFNGVPWQRRCFELYHYNEDVLNFIIFFCLVLQDIAIRCNSLDRTHHPLWSVWQCRAKWQSRFIRLRRQALELHSDQIGNHWLNLQELQPFEA